MCSLGSGFCKLKWIVIYQLGYMVKCLSIKDFDVTCLSQTNNVGACWH